MNRRVLPTRGFTLVELLVVVFIIGVAAALLVPAALRSLSRARQTACLANLKQMSAGLLAYADEHNGYALPAEPAAPIGHWLNWLYVEALAHDARVVRCPALSRGDMFNPYGGDGAYEKLDKAGYLMNIVREGDDHGWTGLPATISTDPDVSFGWVTGSATQPVQLDRVLRPEAKLWVVDSAPGLTNTASAIGIFRMKESDHGPLDTTGDINAGFRKVGWQHNGNFNVLWGDGHGEGRQRTEHEEWNVHQQ